MSDQNIGFSDFDWLRKQAQDAPTRELINTIEQDELAFREQGISSSSNELFCLNLKQGKIWAYRSTAHSVAHVFTQMFYKDEHVLVQGFTAARTIVDIGANEGYYLLKMLTLNPASKAIAVEPNPIALELLRRNIASNGLQDRVTVVPKAVWKDAQGVELQVIPQVTSISSASKEVMDSYKWLDKSRIQTIKVESVTLPQLMTDVGWNEVDILKIDTEGAELDILQAGVAALEDVQKIVIEYHSHELRDAITALLAGSGFTLVHDEPDRSQNGDIYFARGEKTT